jgi:gas vesicle protein
MNNSQEIAATIVGAVIGGVAGFLFFTERGRRVRRQVGPVLEDFSREVMSFRNTVQEVGGVANEGWKLFHDMLGEGAEPFARYPGGQTSPF